MYEIRVEGMTCGGCAARVKRAVLALDDGAEVDVDLKEKTVRVNSDADLGAIKSAIASAGYPVNTASD